MMSKETFELIPAIDIYDSKCVRLTQGDYKQVEEFSNNPLEVAKKWQDNGAQRLHIVDLNGAKEGFPVNFKLISKIAAGLNARVKVQVGGGIRTFESIKNYINEGADYVILSTKALKDKVFLNEALKMYNEKIILALDIKDNEVALSGWLERSSIKLNDALQVADGVKQFIYTDISKDGTLSSPNLKKIKEITSNCSSEVIISGGISKMEDILSVLSLKKEGAKTINGVIVGKALYKGTIDLKEAIEATQKALNPNT